MKYAYIANGLSLKLDTETCIGCGMCIEVCPHAVFMPDGKKVRIADRSSCMECGACMRNCPVNAIQVQTGVGCAAAIIGGILNKGNPGCGCGEGCCSNG